LRNPIVLLDPLPAAKVGRGIDKGGQRARREPLDALQRRRRRVSVEVRKEAVGRVAGDELGGRAEVAVLVRVWGPVRRARACIGERSEEVVPQRIDDEHHRAIVRHLGRQRAFLLRQRGPRRVELLLPGSSSESRKRRRRDVRLRPVRPPARTAWRSNTVELTPREQEAAREEAQAEQVQQQKQQQD